MEIETVARDFAVSAQLAADDVAELAQRGFAGIVCNRPDAEVPGQPDAETIADAAAAAGLDFIHIPIAPGAMTDDDARRLARFVEHVGGPVLGYCRTGARAKALWERTRALSSGTD